MGGIEPGAGAAEAGHEHGAAAQNHHHGPGAVGIPCPTPRLFDEGLDLGAAVETLLADADELLGLGYNAGAEPGTAVMARLTICAIRCRI